MTEILRWNDADDDDLYNLPDHDSLGVLSSTKVVVEQGEYVWINEEPLAALARQWVQEYVGRGEGTGAIDQPALSSSPLPSPEWDTAHHFSDGSERTVNWLLVLDALNFCFWAEKGQPRWSLEYRGETLNGYWAEASALKRAVEEGVALWDATYLSTISEDALAHIFRGSETIPLFEQRLFHVREVGRVLLERYNGQFSRAIEQAGYNAVQLAHLLARDFSSFNDVALYRNRPVYFLKRAQICVSDLVSAFGGKHWGALADLPQLTAFADYKLPQILRHYTVLEYDPVLAQRVDEQELLAPGSEEEIEIRAATIWACELLRRALLEYGQVMSAAEIDQRLWLISQEVTDMKPYHRTRTIYY